MSGYDLNGNHIGQRYPTITGGNYGQVRRVNDSGIIRCHELTGSMTSLLHPSTGKFGFATIQGNGASFAPSGIVVGGSSYTAGGLDLEYANGVPGLFERVDDSAFIGGTGMQAAASQLFAWKVSCLTTHKGIGSGTRTELRGYPLEFYKRYVFDYSFRLDNSGGAGFDFGQLDVQGMGIFQMHQESGYAGNNQLGTSPAVQIYLQGSRLYFITRAVDSEMGLMSGGNLVWGFGDFQILNHGYVVLSGVNYKDLVIDTFVDDRRADQGGMGYVRATINGRLFCNYTGPTAWPTPVGGVKILPVPKFGMYMTALNGGVTDDVTINSSRGMLNNRAMLMRKVRIMSDFA